MNIHMRVVGILWTLVGLALGAEAVWGLMTEDRYQSVVESWVITLVFALASIAAGLAFGRTGLLGRVLIRLVSVAALLYSAAWLVFGGLDDAQGYWPAVIFAVALAVYALFVSRSAPSAA